MGRVSHLCALLDVPVELQQAVPGGFGGRGQGEGLFHVGGPVPQPALDAISLIELLHLWDRERRDWGYPGTAQEFGKGTSAAFPGQKTQQLTPNLSVGCSSCTSLSAELAPQYPTFFFFFSGVQPALL